MPTIKEITDMYLNRQRNTDHVNIRFLKGNLTASYPNVVNIFRDGIKVETLELDDKEYKYEFDYGYGTKIHICFRGSIMEFSYDINEE